MSAHIMVINDNQEILTLFEEILTEEGYSVSLYSFAMHDLAEVEQIKPDLIILDHIMGGEAVGWQMLQKLKMRRSTANIPVVVCTAAVKAVQEMEGYLKAKGVGLVLKPFDIEDLLEAVALALATRNAIPSMMDDPSITTSES